MKISIRFGILMFSLCAIFLRPISSLAQLGQAQAKQGYITPHPPVQGPLLKHPPKMTKEKLERYERALAHTHGRIITPVDPTVRPETIRPTNPETVPNFRVQQEEIRIVIQQPETFTIFRNTALDDSAMNNATSSTNEPSLGVNGRVLFWTGNRYASVSGDGG